MAENNKSSQQSHINKELWKLTSGDFVAQHLRDKVAATPNTVYHQPGEYYIIMNPINTLLYSYDMKQKHIYTK